MSDKKSGVLAVIPFYKGTADNLKACIESLLQQDCYPFRIIVMDDHSPNPAKNMLSDYDEIISVVRNDQNLGFSGNLNKALLLAETNEGFLFVIQDDVTLINKNYVNKCIRNFESASVAVVCGQPVLKLEKNDRRASFARYWDLDFIQEGLTQVSYSLLKADMFRISALKKIGGFLYTQNKSLGLEDQVTANQLRKNSYSILKDGTLKYSVEDVRSDSFSNFLKKESNYGITMGFAVAFGAISADLNDNSSRSKRNHRIRQVVVISLFLFLLILGIIAGTYYLLIDGLIISILLAEITIYILHGKNLRLPLKLYLGAIGLIADFVFMFSFTYGYFQGILSKKNTN